MKRIICVLMIAVLLSGAAGCAANNQGASGGYKDGTYTGAGDAWEHGSEDATVTVKDGKIESIVLRRLDTSGKEVDYNQFSGQTVDGQTYPDLKSYRESTAKAMIDKQSYDVDTTTGATTSTGNWKAAVQRALEKAKK